eukprot:scaffold60477_cov36-Phaeocystis_antarctica.AAC.2
MGRSKTRGDKAARAAQPLASHSGAARLCLCHCVVLQELDDLRVPLLHGAVRRRAASLRRGGGAE